MFTNENIINYVHPKYATPEEFANGPRQMLTAKIAAIARSETVSIEDERRILAALDTLIERQRKKLAEANPADATLPKIEDWWFGRRQHEQFIIVIGDVTNHPLLPDGPVETSPVYHWDQPRSLIATQNTIYRVGSVVDFSSVQWG